MNINDLTNTIQGIKDAKEDLRGAINAKGGTLADDAKLSEFKDAVEGLPSGEIVEQEEKDVNFYDYDGTVLFSYNTEEFLTISEMPNLPTHRGLVCQGWNWDLGDAMEFVQRHGMLDIGAMYITDDGRTRLYITVSDNTTKEIQIKCKTNSATGTITIDWGDGSKEELPNGNVNVFHTYGHSGDYVISFIIPSTSRLYLEGASNKHCVMGDYDKESPNRIGTLKRIELGDRTNIGIHAFDGCYNLEHLTFPTSLTGISSRAFNCCTSIQCIIIPSSVTLLGDYSTSSCYSLQVVSIPKSMGTVGAGQYTMSRVKHICLPEEFTSVGNNFFSSCPALYRVNIPLNATMIGLNAFNGCYNLAKILIPASVINIFNNAFYGCRSLSYVDLSQHTSIPTLANAQVFTNVNINCKFIVPDALYDEWVSATNWSTYADKIIKASEYTES